MSRGLRLFILLHDYQVSLVHAVLVRYLQGFRDEWGTSLLVLDLSFFCGAFFPAFLVTGKGTVSGLAKKSLVVMKYFA